MAEFSAPPMVWAAMARHGLLPGDLLSYEVLGPDILLRVSSTLVIVVAISSLPKLVVEASQGPVHGQNVGDGPDCA